MKNRDIFNRAEILLGSEVMEKLHKSRVILFGVGGVGSWCAEGLIRAGIGELTIVDSDRIAPSNINRQLMATTKTVGLVKVQVLKYRLSEINPEAKINAIQEIYSEETAESFDLDSYDYIIDAIDSLKNKIDLLYTASKTKATVLSSMGAALKIDPTKIKVAEFKKVKGCPLAAIIRKRMRQRKLWPEKKILCVYDDEVLNNRGIDRLNSEIDKAENLDKKLSASADTGKQQLNTHNWSDKKAAINGTTVGITAIFGFTLANLIIKDIYYKYI